MKIPMKQPKFKEGDWVKHTDLHNAPIVKIVTPVRYEDTDYGWDWVYKVKYMNDSHGELYQIDLKRSN
jgi:hypothetical protein